MADDFEIVASNARIVLDSRGNQTVECDIFTPYSMGRSSAPSGASTGKTEVAAFPKGGAAASLEFFNSKVRRSINGFNALDQKGFDALLGEIDGTENFSAMGGNLSTVLSIACAKAVANGMGIPLYRYVGGMGVSVPDPLGNVIGGGKHSKNGTTIQEFMVSAQGKTFLESITVNSLVHKRIGEKLQEKLKDQSIGVGDERAWTAPISDDLAIDIVTEAAKEVTSESKVNVRVGSDFAATSFYKNGKYVYRNHTLSKDDQIDFAVSLIKDRGFFLLEDPMEEGDFDGFASITESTGKRGIIVGDDIYTTKASLIRKGIEKKSSNAVLIKVNQVGTLTSTLEAVEVARAAGWKNVISHRSGETTDDFLAHLAVAFRSSLIKSGTIGGERLAKLNELVRIQEDLTS